MSGVIRPLARLIGAAVLLLVWLNLSVQMNGLPVAGLDLRTFGARFLLCYVAAFWLHLSWQTIARRYAGAPAVVR